MSRHLRLWLVLASFGTVTNAQESPSVELRLRPVPSTTVVEDSASKLSFSFSVLGQKQTMQAEQSRSVQVTTGPRLEDGSVRVVRATRQLKAKVRPPRGKSIEFDSARPNEKLPDYFRTQVAARLVYTFDRNNKLIAAAVENPEAIAGLNEAARASFQSASLIAARSTVGAWLPSKAVAVGESWEREDPIRIDRGQELKVVVVYTYAGLATFEERELHRIDTKIKSATVVAGKDALITEGKLKPLASSKGTVWFDVEAGRVEDLNQKVRLRGPVSANLGGRKVTTRLTVNFDSTVRINNVKPGESRKPLR